MSAERVYAPQYAPQYAPEREFKVKPVKKKVSGEFNTRTKKRMISAIVLGGMVLIALVIGTALISHMAYANNQLRSENKEIASEIQNLKIDVKSATNIGTVESLASEKLGMVYPAGEQFVQLGGVESASDNFAEVLREEAFK